MRLLSEGVHIPCVPHRQSPHPAPQDKEVAEKSSGNRCLQKRHILQFKFLSIKEMHKAIFLAELWSLSFALPSAAQLFFEQCFCQPILSPS